GGRGDAGAGAPRPHALLLRGPDPGRDRPGARGDREPGLPDPHQGDPPAALPPPRTRTGPGRVIPGARPPSWSTLAPLRRTGFDPRRFWAESVPEIDTNSSGNGSVPSSPRSAGPHPGRKSEGELGRRRGHRRSRRTGASGRRSRTARAVVGAGRRAGREGIRAAEAAIRGPAPRARLCRPA